MEHVIELTGMTKGALYHHLDSKESLVSAIIEENSAEGDLRQDVDRIVISESIAGAVIETQLLSIAISAKGLESDPVKLTGRTSQMWELVLVGVAAQPSLPISGNSFVAKQCAMPGPPLLATAPPSRRSGRAPWVRCWGVGRSGPACGTLPEECILLQ